VVVSRVDIKMVVNTGTRLPNVRRKLSRRMFYAPLANLRGILRRNTGRNTRKSKLRRHK